jgi:hypothetical protein
MELLTHGVIISGLVLYVNTCSICRRTSILKETRNGYCLEGLKVSIRKFSRYVLKVFLNSLNSFSSCFYTNINFSNASI